MDTTQSPIDAIARLGAAPPKVLITDFRMPEIDGVQVLREARRLAPDTVRILLTSHADRENVIEAINEGKIYRFMSKPWDNDELAALVQEAIAAHELSRAAHLNLQIGRDVEEIGALQRDMLPGNKPHLVSGETAMAYHAAEHVSGDYADVFALNNDRTALILGDVCGHGIGAALFVFTARALLRSALTDGVDLDVAMARTNRFLCQDMAEGRFMTLFAGIFDPHAGALLYANAGQAFPFVLRGDDVTELERTALPFGLLENADYGSLKEIEFDHHSTIFACSDGLLEARNANGDYFGAPLLAKTLADAEDKAPDTLLGEVRKALTEFRGAIDDDLSMLAYRPKPNQPKQTNPNTTKCGTGFGVAQP